MKTTGKIALLLVIIMVFTSVLCSCGGGSKSSAIEGPTTLNNKKKVTLDESIDAYTNGYFAKELKALAKIAAKTDDYEDIYDDFEEMWEDQYDEYVDDYGKNFKITVKITDEDDIKSKDLKNYQETFRGYGETLKDYAKAYKKLDKDDIEDIADDLGCSKKDLDEAMGYIDTMGTALKKCEVTEGYELEATMTIKGSEDEDEKDGTFDVIKIDGNWVSPDYFKSVYRQIIYYFNGLTSNLAIK